MKPSIKISIITVCKNSRKFIAETIESVKNQTYSNIEYIIIDGGSTDGTQDIIIAYNEYISTYISEPDQGMYDAINKGLAHASGDYILVLNSDDQLATEDILEKVVNEILRSPADLYYGNILHLTEKGIRKVRVFPADYHMLLYATHSTFVPHPSLFISAALNSQIGGYDTKYQFAADYDYILRALKAPGTKGKYLNLDITKFRVHDQSISASGRINPERWQIIKEHGYFNTSFLKRNFFYYLYWSYYKWKNKGSKHRKRIMTFAL